MKIRALCNIAPAHYFGRYAKSLKAAVIRLRHFICNASRTVICLGQIPFNGHFAVGVVFVTVWF